MKETIEALNGIAAAIEGVFPSWVTAIEAFAPIVLTVITIILSVRMDKQNKRLQRELHNRDVSSQARHDILEIYDAFCQTLFVLKKRGPVAAIFSNMTVLSIWIQELCDASIKTYMACDRSKLLLDDKELTEYLRYLTQKYDEIYTSILSYTNSSVSSQMCDNEKAKCIQAKITEYNDLLSDDAFDARFKKYLTINEFPSKGHA